MKHFIPAMLAVAMFIAPIGAVAGEPSASGETQEHGMIDRLNLSPAQQQAFKQMMTQCHTQIEQLHIQARARILSEITPAHRALLSQLTGALATSPNPDKAAAVRQLNAALSPGEAQAVISTHAAAEQQMHAIMQSAHQKMQSMLTPQQRALMPNEANEKEHMGGHEMSEMSKKTAGDILIHMALKGGEEHEGMGHEMHG